MDLDEFLESLMKTERVPKFPLSMYYSEGVKYLNLRQYNKAQEFFNNAVDMDPTDIKSLLKRSKCLIALRDYKGAIEDANKVLNLYPNNIEAIDLKGQAQYMMGDFEQGYLTYLEGRKKKPVNNAYRLGKQLCEDAMNSSLHPSCELIVNRSDVSCIAKTQQDDDKFENRLKYRRSTQDCFKSDKTFLEELMRDKNLASVHGICKEGVDYIKDCERFWSMVTPLYTRKKRSKLFRREINRMPDAEKQIMICNAAKRRAKAELNLGRIEECVFEVKKMLNEVEYLHKQNTVEKMKFKCDAYHILSLAYKRGGYHSLVFQHLYKELEIADEFNLFIERTRTYHQLGELYNLVGSYSKAIYCFYNIVFELSPEEFEKLEKEGTSAEDIKCLQDAQEWAKEMHSDLSVSLRESLRHSIRESIINPVINTIIQYSEEKNSNNLNDENEQSSELND